MLHRFKKYFLSGLAVFLPLALAVYVFFWIMNFFESLLGKYLKPFFLEYYDFYFWGIGIFFLTVIILFCGFLVTHYFGRFVHRVTENLVLQVPLLGTIYPAFKEISRFLFRERVNDVQKVVMVQWPREGIYVVAFLTNKTADIICEKAGRKMSNVLIPTVPNPLTGFVVMIPDEDITPLPVSVEDAVRILVSGGVLNGDPLKSAEADEFPKD